MLRDAFARAFDMADEEISIFFPLLIKCCQPKCRNENDNMILCLNLCLIVILQ
jgi:hypothetical protein